MGKRSGKIFRFLVVFLVITGLVFSNASFYLVKTLVDSYISTRGIVDRIWLTQKDSGSDIVDKYASIRDLPEKLRIHTALAAVSYVGGQVGSSAGVSGNTTVNFSLTNGSASTPAADDLVIVAFSNGDTANKALTINNSGGTAYTLAGSELYQNDSYDSNLRVAYRFMPGTPETSVILAGGDASGGRAWSVHVFRNVDAGTPLDVAAVTAGAINTRVVNPGAITPTSSGAWIYVAGAGSGSTGGNYTASYLTDFRAANGNDTQDGMVGAGYTTWSSGAYDPAAFAGGGTTTTSDSWTAVTLALRPYADTPPTVTVDNPASDTDVADGGNYQIQYDLADAGTATADFYYETDGNGAGGTAISSCQNQIEGTNATCSFSPLGEGMSLSTYYYIYGVANDGVNPDVVDVSTGRIRINDAPTLTVTQPDGTGDTIAQDGTYNYITYNLADTDSTVTVDFYYDTDGTGLNGTSIAACQNQGEASGGTCAWNTTGVSPGTYYIYGRDVNDTVNTEVSDYSPGVVTINARPTLTVSQPDGVSDSVPIGTLYNITYDLADSDNIVNAVFYWDSNGSGLDGTAITGACASAGEGTGATCSWDTAGMSAGSYYVYGLVSDGVNSQVNDYSSGTITLSAGTLSVDIVDSGGTPVGSPSVSFSAETFDWVGQTSAGTLGVASQKIRLTNTTANGNWNLTIAATGGASTLWQGATYNYDFNDTAANGRLRVDPSAGTITPEGGCGAVSPSKGSAAYFDAGNSVTLLTSTTSFGCYWDFTGVALTQDIPAQQQADSYSIGMTLTAT
ncbi:MAG: hypothetical protein AAB487_01245 [Patescibacteria group bacterium]